MQLISQECTAPLFGSAALAAMAGTTGPEADYWRLVIESGPSSLAPNLSTLPGILVRENGFCPITVNSGHEENAYPCSLFTQYVRYPLAELRLLKTAALRRGVSLALRGLGALLKLGEVDRAVQWNGWLLSTNLLPSLAVGELRAATCALVEHFTGHALVVKNVHDREKAELPGLFLEAGFRLIPSRKIYFFDGREAAFMARSNVKQDLNALRKLTEYRTVEHDEFSLDDAPRIARLYEMLYLEKHSRLNPAYTPFFVRNALEKRFLEFRGLRHKTGRIDAVFGCFKRGGIVTTPFVGYDTSVNQEVGLYRLLVAMLLKRVAEEGMLLNFSSGAGEFKRRRGGQGCIEFNAVYVRHLSARRRLAFALLEGGAQHFGRRFLSGNAV